MEVSPNSTTQPLNMYDYINSSVMNPIAFTALAVLVIIVIFVSVYLGKNSNSNSNGQADGMANTNTNTNNATKIYGIIAVILFVALIIVNGVQYFFGINFFASIQNILTGTPEVDIKVVPESEEKSKLAQPTTIEQIIGVEQVFNIPGNTYNYGDAKALCTAYGARLATYNEVETAYNNGGEWCNYGWSDGQMALFPTQNTTFKNLQKIKGHKHDCGRPGVNGGYIANPAVKFGVNCYGHKPKINQEERHLMDVTTPYPKTKEELTLEKQVAYWKNKLDQILVSPFNYSSWSKV
jgi:preprotein translocase subunit SecG